MCDLHTSGSNGANALLPVSGLHVVPAPGDAPIITAAGALEQVAVISNGGNAWGIGWSTTHIRSPNMCWRWWAMPR